MTIPSKNSVKPATLPPCTHTFDAWSAFAVSYAAQHAVSGKYGVDFRFAPQPTRGERRTLRLLDAAASSLGPSVVKRNAQQFDYDENANARVLQALPCATPNAHARLQQSFSTSTTATPRASPAHDRNRFVSNRTQQQAPAPALNNNNPQSTLLAAPAPGGHDVELFFNFDLASPSATSDAVSVPPDTDIEQEQEQEQEQEETDTESERELRLEDLEGPYALRRFGRGRARGRAMSMSMAMSSTTASSAVQEMSPVSPASVRSEGHASAVASHFVPNPNPNPVPSSALRPVYARRAPDPTQTQSQSQSHLQQSQPHAHFPTSISESGAGTGGSLPLHLSASGHGSGLEGGATARARIRGRGVGAPRIEPEVTSGAQNQMSMAMGPGTGAGAGTGGGYSVGPYGYRYPVYSLYQGASGSGRGYAPTGLCGNVGLSDQQAHPNDGQRGDAFESDSGRGSQRQQQQQNWGSMGEFGSTGLGVSMGMSMGMDVDMGGWGRVSEPLPPGRAVDLPFGGGGMQFGTTPGAGTYGHGFGQQTQAVYSQQQNGQMASGVGYAAPVPAQDVSMNIQEQTQMPMGYYSTPTPAPSSSSHLHTSATPSSLATPARNVHVNPGLNMTPSSPSRWKTNANANTNVKDVRMDPPSPTVVGPRRGRARGQGQRGAFWPTSDLRGGP